MKKLKSQAISPTRDFVVEKECFDHFFSKGIPNSTFHDLVNKGRIIPAPGLRGRYLLNASLLRLGLPEAHEIPGKNRFGPSTTWRDWHFHCSILLYSPNLHGVWQEVPRRLAKLTMHCVLRSNIVTHLKRAGAWRRSSLMGPACWMSCSCLISPRRFEEPISGLVQLPDRLPEMHRFFGFQRTSTDSGGNHLSKRITPQPLDYKGFPS